MQVPLQEQRRQALPYKWLVLIVIVFGLFMSVLDGTIVHIAVPRIQTAFGANLNDAHWVHHGSRHRDTSYRLFSGRLGINRFSYA